ncbi:MAG TPA: AAA family ATPase, partial [Clostridiales bacterium]|nr:AAA family ATPase [Clostridiales bacterium]
AMGRKIARVSLGGVRDEADIRGHRKTYIGAMPGRIMTALVQAGAKNAVLLLDEVDKLGADYKGDPSAALLEVLDAEQNHSFRDHYLEVPFDLSEVLFITTANTTSTIPRPLLDRMEVIELSSYTREEKVQIAKKHLLPKQLKLHGLKRAQFRITDDGLRAIIEGYTREPGVRTLERTLASCCRKAARKIASGEVQRITLTPKDLHEVLGNRRYKPEHLDKMHQVGVVNGLAWTQSGGEILEAEVNVMPGSGKIELTGNLGSVMKESARAAISYLRVHAKELHLSENFYKELDIHVHFPEGAIPKDGPSAGITIATAILSALSGRPARYDVAMTGEISLRGRVLPIGGMKEKTMAAYRAGIQQVIIPADNEVDLQDIDPTVREALSFSPVSNIGEVFEIALLPAPVTEQEERSDEEVEPLAVPTVSGEPIPAEPRSPFAVRAYQKRS